MFSAYFIGLATFVLFVVVLVYSFKIVPDSTSQQTQLWRKII